MNDNINGLEIIDYYKNSKFYNDSLEELIPTNDEGKVIDDSLKGLVEKFDELTFNKRREIPKIVDENVLDILSDETGLTYSILDGLINIQIYENDSFFQFEAFISSSLFENDQPLRISHRFYRNRQVLLIEEDLSKGGYVGVVNLNKKTDSLSNPLLADELEIIEKLIQKFSIFMTEFYLKNNDCKKLSMKKN